MGINNDGQKYYAFASTYGDGSTAFHYHGISVVVFFCSNKLQIMLVDYAVNKMSCFDYYSEATPRAKTRGGNGITIFLLHVAQCITFNQTIFVAATLIYEARLKALYSRLGFKVIKDFATSPNFKEARKRFHYKSGKSKSLQKQKIGLQYYITIPRSVADLHDNRIEFN